MKHFICNLFQKRIYIPILSMKLVKPASASVVWGLLMIALFIIVIAWVNYINLATARSTERAKEVGIRKVVGGLKKQLINTIPDRISYHKFSRNCSGIRSGFADTASF